MSKGPKLSIELHQLCGKLREGEITDAEAKRLDTLLLESKAARRFYCTFMALASALETRSSVQDTLDAGMDSRKNMDVLSELFQSEQQGADTEKPKPVSSVLSAKALAELARLHDEGLKQPLELALQQREQKQQAAAAHRRNVVRARLVIGGSLAAVIALAGLVALAVSLFTQPQSPLANEPNESHPVMTLTQAFDAAWQDALGQSRTLAVGQELHSGQTLVLTEGVAQLTTPRGAIAILEAPATIELIDSPNAIRLNAGKLVGVCETETSKGFLVRTPHMDITDLGTRFGVDASQADATSVHVLDGEIEVVNISPSGEPAAEPQRLDAGQALRADPLDGLTSVGFEELPFVQDIEHYSYHPEVGGHASVWRGQASGDLSLDARQADALQVFIERKGVRLQRDTAVDVVGDGAWTKGSVPGQQTVSAGKRVDVYLLHLDPVSRESVGGDYTIRFDRPILGVIAHQDTLVATDATLGAAGVTYPVITGERRPAGDGFVEAQRGLDTALSERASLTEGNTALQLKSNAVELCDQVRVLVQAMEEQD